MRDRERTEEQKGRKKRQRAISFNRIQGVLQMSEVQGNVGSGDFVQNHERALQTLGVTFEQEETSEQIDAAVGSKGFRSEVENLYNDLCWREVEILDHKIENAEFDSGFQDGFQQGELEVVRYVLNRLFNVLATTDEPS